MKKTPSDNLLYFPYIDIPKSNWTIKSLLYWDKVGIIVPPKYIDYPHHYERFTRDLLQSDLVEQIFPFDFIWSVSDFDKGFMQLINQPIFNVKKRQKKFANGSYTRIHVQKFGNGLLNNLVSLGIAKRDCWDWYHVECDTAHLIMLYLATIIGRKGDYTPATDSIRNLDTTIRQTGTAIRLNKIRQNIIDDLIPYPIESNLTRLRNFKDKYHDELTSYRHLIEQFAYELSIIKLTEQRQALQTLKLQEINFRREKILSDLNQSKFNQITFGTMCGLTGAIVGFSAENNILGTFSLLNAVYSAFEGYDRKHELRSDYSYLALIDKELR